MDGGRTVVGRALRRSDDCSYHSVPDLKYGIVNVEMGIGTGCLGVIWGNFSRGRSGKRRAATGLGTSHSSTIRNMRCCIQFFSLRVQHPYWGTGRTSVQGERAVHVIARLSVRTEAYPTLQ